MRSLTILIAIFTSLSLFGQLDYNESAMIYYLKYNKSFRKNISNFIYKNKNLKKRLLRDDSLFIEYQNTRKLGGFKSNLLYDLKDSAKIIDKYSIIKYDSLVKSLSDSIYTINKNILPKYSKNEEMMHFFPYKRRIGNVCFLKLEYEKLPLKKAERGTILILFFFDEKNVIVKSIMKPINTYVYPFAED